MRKVFKLTVYRSGPVNAMGGRVNKEVVGEFESREAAQAASDDIKASDPTFKNSVISVDWR